VPYYIGVYKHLLSYAAGIMLNLEVTLLSVLECGQYFVCSVHFPCFVFNGHLFSPNSMLISRAICYTQQRLRGHQRSFYPDNASNCHHTSYFPYKYQQMNLKIVACFVGGGKPIYLMALHPPTCCEIERDNCCTNY
jgi:hypothetical protein